MSTPTTPHPESTPHPEPALLAAFLDGRLADPQRLDVESHVAACETCCEAMSKLPLDPLSARLRDISDDEVADSSDWSIVTARSPETASAPAAHFTHSLPAELQDHPRYRILEPLGHGGMGVVYKAQHRLMDRIVALKVIDGRLIENPQMIDRFRNEVKAAAMLTHANIVRAYDAEQAGSLHFLVMEYVDGISLAELIQRKGPLPTEQALGIVRKVAHGLQHAYQHGMVHRDIKPQNIMVTRTGKVRILDFGLARFAREREHANVEPGADPETVLQRTADSLTLVGSILGTPDYIAPEQVMDAHQADTRADIYSLGCTCYFLLTGRPPFPTGTTLQKLIAHRDQTPTSITELRRDVPPQIARLIERMMARDVKLRLQTPLEVATAIDDVNSGNKLSAPHGKSQAATDRTAFSKSTDATTPSTATPGPAAIQESAAGDAGADVLSKPVVRQNAVRGRRIQQRPANSASWGKRLGVPAVILVLLLAAGLIVQGFRSQPEPAAERADSERPSTANTPATTTANTTANTANELPTRSARTPVGTAAPTTRLAMTDAWINLIPQIDPARDGIAGTWRKANGELVVAANEGARLVLPVDVPAEYDFEIEFTRHNGVHSIALIFAVDGHQATFDIDAWGRHVAGIQNIAGQSIQPSNANSTMVSGQELVNGQRYVAAVRVRRDSVQAWLNQRLLATYRGNGSDLSLIPEWQLREERASLAIGAYDSPTTFHRIRVRAVSE